MIYEDISPIIDGVLNKINASYRHQAIKGKQQTLRQGSQSDLQFFDHCYSAQDRELEWDSFTSGQNEVSILTLNDEKGFSVGCAVWSFGYSTWKGRVMNLDALKVTKLKDENDLHYALMRGLVEVALALDCARLVHSVRFLNKYVDLNYVHPLHCNSCFLLTILIFDTADQFINGNSFS